MLVKPDADNSDAIGRAGARPDLLASDRYISTIQPRGFEPVSATSTQPSRRDKTDTTVPFLSVRTGDEERSGFRLTFTAEVVAKMPRG